MAKGDIPNTNTSASANSMGQKMQPTGNMAPWMQTANSGMSSPMGMNRQQPMGNMMNQPRFMMGHGIMPSPAMMQHMFGGMNQGGQGGGYQAPQQPQSPMGMNGGDRQPIQPLMQNMGIGGMNQ